MTYMDGNFKCNKWSKKIHILFNRKSSRWNIFTSCTTKSNNLAIKGLAQFYKNKKHILTTSIEYKYIINTWGDLENKGYKIIYLLVNKK